MADEKVIPGSMTLEQFSANAHKLSKMSTATVDLARLVLVEGRSFPEAAKEIGVSRQNVHKTVQRVVAAFEGIPAGYVELKAWVPKAMYDEVHARLEELSEQRKQGQ